MCDLKMSDLKMSDLKMSDLKMCDLKMSAPPLFFVACMLENRASRVIGKGENDREMIDHNAMLGNSLRQSYE